MKTYSPIEAVQRNISFYRKRRSWKDLCSLCDGCSFSRSGKEDPLDQHGSSIEFARCISVDLTNRPQKIYGVANLYVANLDPLQAAMEYKERVVGPYRGVLPDSVIHNMEEQLSGSCTVEIAAFNEFSSFITDETIQKTYDYIIFDTAPTGHTLRMLQLPSAWSDFINENTHGASCLGQLSGLESKKDIYKRAVQTLADAQQTTLILVTRPEESPLKEADRAAKNCPK